MVHILVAPNAYKHSIAADVAAESIARGLERSRLHCRVTCFPLGDGGDGTRKLIETKLNGQSVHLTVCNPLGRKIRAEYSLIDNGRTAVIELADASGIRLICAEEQDPMRASSVGTGELIRHALGKRVNHIIIAMGGSATVDGGCGIMHALGARFVNGEGEILPPNPMGLTALKDVDLSGLDSRLLTCQITVLCDVSNQLIGPTGAATTFAPQKGATAQQVEALEAFLTKLSEIVTQKTGRAMKSVIFGGAAGGAAAGMFALANANLVDGIGFFLDITGFHEVLTQADWLITGEGSLDDQTLDGKGPFGVAKLAKQRGIPVIGLAGNVPLQPSEQLLNTFDVLLPINNSASDLEKAIGNTQLNLARTAQAAGNLISASMR